MRHHRRRAWCGVPSALAVFFAAGALCGCLFPPYEVKEQSSTDGNEVMDKGVTGETYGHLAIGGGIVFWSRDGALLSMETSAEPGAEPTKHFDSTYKANFLAVHGDRLDFTSFDNKSVYECSTSGCKPEIIAANETATLGLAVTDKGVYWTQYLELGHVRQLDMGSAMATDLVYPVNLPFYLVAEDGGDVFWTYRGGNDVGGVQKGTMLDDAVDIASDQPSPSGLAVDATDVYWMSYDGSVKRAPRSGDGPVTEIGPAAGPKSMFGGELVVDVEHVYWAGPGLNSCVKVMDQPCDCEPPCGKIWRASKEAPAPEVFAEGEWGDVWGIAQDDDYIYWTTGADGRLMRKSKK